MWKLKKNMATVLNGTYPFEDFLTVRSVTYPSCDKYEINTNQQTYEINITATLT